MSETKHSHAMELLMKQPYIWNAEPASPSAEAPSKVTGPLPVVGSGGVVGLRGIESEIIRVATALEHNAMTREAIVGEWLPLDGFQNQLQLEARAMRESAKILRRHVASENERQPEPNGAYQPTPGNGAAQQKESPNEN